MYVTCLLDVEDIIDPEADDITRDVAGILAEEGVRATFCVVGERARQWRQRRRDDVVASLSHHDVGYHTDMHSIHPTVAEYLADRGWEDGVDEAARRDEPGVRAVTQVCGAPPSCWGGPGNTWGPQVNAAMGRLGVPALVYAHTGVPGGGIHRFGGILAYPCGHHVGDADYHDTEAWERNMARLVGQLEADQAAGRPWVEVFTGHPSRILHHEFWDGPNFSRGQNPPPGRWVRARRKTDSELATALANLRRTARTLASLPGIELRTIREMNALAAAGTEQDLSQAERDAVWPAIDAELAAMAGWVIHRPDLDTTRIRQVTHEQLGTLRRVVLAG